MSFLKRLRGAIGLGLSWAAVWAIVGFVAHPLLRLATNGPPGLLGAFGDALWVGWYGFLMGALFSAVLAVTGRSRSLQQLIAPRIALTGAAASVFLTLPPTLYMALNRTDGFRTSDVIYFLASLALCTGCATATLLLARRGKAAPNVLDAKEPHTV